MGGRNMASVGNGIREKCEKVGDKTVSEWIEYSMRLGLSGAFTKREK